METMRVNRRPRWGLRISLLALVLVGLGFATVPVRAQTDLPQTHTGGQYSAPVPGAVLRQFDPPARPWLAGHRGVDLAVARGQEILAAGDGRVAFAGVVVDRPVVSIDHPSGLRTTYEPVTPNVSAGQQVARGQVIGTLAASAGHCAQDCLHWGARIGEQDYIDPLLLLAPPRVRLYPPEPW